MKRILTGKEIRVAKEMKSYALTLQRYGRPCDVVEPLELPLPPLAPGEIAIKLLLAPINPADIALIEGRYGERPKLPITLGNEGVGEVVELGKGVTSLSPGDRVITPREIGSFCDRRRASAASAIALPKAIPDEVAAMLTVNPLTALLLLGTFVELKKGEWIIQNCATSGVGRAVIDIARAKGLHTINVVRREEQIAEIERAGGDIAITFEGLRERKLPPHSLSLALNGIGGESARHLARSLSFGGTLVTYGAMGGEAVAVDNGPLIYNDIRVRGFWRSRWLKEASDSALREAYSSLFSLAEKGAFKTPIEAIFGLHEAKKAFERALSPDRRGKICFSRE